MCALSYKNSTIEEKIAFHAAPTLLGIKPACMLSLHEDADNLREYISRFNERAAVKNIGIKILCSCSSHSVILVFNRVMLDGRRYMLAEFGYDSHMTLDQCLEQLSSRLCGAISGSGGEYPHEVGIFLGYPREDVDGFIRNKGENFKLCGYWKVYGDEVKAKRTFENYTKCRSFLCNKLSQGCDIYQALKIS
ncbi:MAG: DUF3793 family protein [Oscillospiraceae bacterium]|nr:DUF3793 family protein [Oscillospiraceae bacterium]